MSKVPGMVEENSDHLDRRALGGVASSIVWQPGQLGLSDVVARDEGLHF